MTTAVFFMSETCDIPGVDDQTIHIFDDDQSAREFVLRKMIEARLIHLMTHSPPTYCVDGALYEDPRDAVNHVTDSFSTLEFFHVYPAFDHRTAKVTPATDDAIALGC